jgi:hypothetical protein
MIKIKNIIQIIIIISCALLFQACPHGDLSFLYLENHSNDTLAVYVADGFHTAYPDTLLPDKLEDGMLSGDPEGNSTRTIYISSLDLEQIFKQLPKDTLSVFILCMNNINYNINIDSIWNDMKYGNRFLMRYDLSIKDIYQLNLIIHYPPSEAMKDMKMYPPYKE